VRCDAIRAAWHGRGRGRPGLGRAVCRNRKFERSVRGGSRHPPAYGSNGRRSHLPQPLACTVPRRMRPRRLPRILLDAATVVSLILALAVAVLWVRSEIGIADELLWHIRSPAERRSAGWDLRSGWGRGRWGWSEMVYFSREIFELEQPAKPENRPPQGAGAAPLHGTISPDPAHRHVLVSPRVPVRTGAHRRLAQVAPVDGRLGGRKRPALAPPAGVRDPTGRPPDSPTPGCPPNPPPPAAAPARRPAITHTRGRMVESHRTRGTYKCGTMPAVTNEHANKPAGGWPGAGT
jgi:hypothetical protein